MNVRGPLADRPRCLALLDEARKLVLNYRPPEARLQLPGPADVRALGRPARNSEGE